MATVTEVTTEATTENVEEAGEIEFNSYASLSEPAAEEVGEAAREEEEDVVEARAFEDSEEAGENEEADASLLEPDDKMGKMARISR